LLPDQRKNEDQFLTVTAKFKLNNSPFLFDNLPKTCTLAYREEGTCCTVNRTAWWGHYAFRFRFLLSTSSDAAHLISTI